MGVSDLEEDIHTLIRLLSETPPPEYHEIRIFVEPGGWSANGRPKWNKTNTLSIDDFSQTYAKLKGLGLRWMNLQAVGVCYGVLMVAVEFPSHGTASIPTPVNFSGPYRNMKTGEFDWDITQYCGVEWWWRSLL